MKTCDYFRSKPEVLLEHELVELVGPVGTKPHPLWSSMVECTWFNVVRIVKQGWYWYVGLYDINATTGHQTAAALLSSVFVTWVKGLWFLSTVNRFRGSLSNTRSLELIRCDIMKFGLYKIRKTHKTLMTQEGFEPLNPIHRRHKNVLTLNSASNGFNTWALTRFKFMIEWQKVKWMCYVNSRV